MTGAVLAGGESRRMGFNKALIEIDGETIVERTIRVLSTVAGVDEVFLVVNDPAPYRGFGVEVHTDIHKGAGSLGGVFTALKRAGSERVFVAACDMPFLDPAAVEVIIRQEDGFDAVVPSAGGRTHPLHSLYSTGAAPAMGEMITKGRLRIGEFLRGARVRYLDENFFKASGVDIARSATNVNTPEELEKYLKKNEKAT